MCVGHTARRGHDFQFKNLHGRDNLAHLRINRRMELKWVLKRYDMGT